MSCSLNDCSHPSPAAGTGLRGSGGIRLGDIVGLLVGRGSWEEPLHAVAAGGTCSRWNRNWFLRAVASRLAPGFNFRVRRNTGPIRFAPA